MKKKILIGLMLFAVLFILLFAGKFIYQLSQQNNNSISGLVLGGTQRMNAPQVEGNSGEVSSSRLFQVKNYASKKIEVREDQQQQITVEQKYEKIGTLNSATAAFDQDNAKTRELISNKNAIVQYENKSGLKGSRNLILYIGVMPAQFEILFSELQKIGKVRSQNITLVDKTSEFKDIKSKKISLEKLRDSLTGLKGQGGSLQDKISLEMKILEVEQQLQDLSVKLGDFSVENEFSTIEFSLTEGQIITLNIPKLIFSSIKFAAATEAALIFITFFAVLTVLIILKILEKLNWLPKLVEKVLKS